MAIINRIEFKAKICNRDLAGYVLYSTDSAWIWVGERKVETIGLAHFPLFTMLAESGNAQQEFVKSVTLRLAKKSQFCQLFFTTDIECEEGEFWSALNESLASKLAEISCSSSPSTVAE